MYPGVQAVNTVVEVALDSLTKTVSALVQKVKGLRKRMDKVELKADKIDIRLGKVEGGDRLDRPTLTIFRR